MESLRQPARPSGLVILLVLLALGCAHTPPAPLSEATQAQLGTLGVVPIRTPPAVEYRTPGQGGAGGAVIGAVKGLGVGTLGAAACFLTLGRVPEPCLLAVATPVVAVSYAVNQARKGVAPEEVAASEAAIRPVLAAPRLPEAVGEAILRVAQEQSALSFVPVPEEEGALQPATAGSYQHLASQGIGTVLEVTVERLALRAAPWSTRVANFNPPLTLAATLRIRVVTVAGDSERYTATLEHQGRVATFTEWGADEAQLLRESLAQLTEDLAAEILRQVFNVSVPSASEPVAPTAPDPGHGMQAQPEPSSPDIAAPEP